MRWEVVSKVQMAHASDLHETRGLASRFGIPLVAGVPSRSPWTFVLV